MDLLHLKCQFFIEYKLWLTTVVEKYCRPNARQLHADGLNTNKFNVLEYLAYLSKTSIALLKETHTSKADKLMIPTLTFNLTVSILSRKHSLATLVHKKAMCTPVEQSPIISDFELCVHVEDYRITDVNKPSLLRLFPEGIPHFYTLIFALVNLTTNTSNGVKA